MSKMAAKRKLKHKPAATKVKPRKRTPDRTIYLGLTLIGFFAVLLVSLFSGVVENWPIYAVGFLALVAYLIVLYTWHVYRGRHLAHWQQALARIPLRPVGYGTKDGKPLEAAHHHQEVFRAFIITLILSVAILAALGWLAWRWVL